MSDAELKDRVNHLAYAVEELDSHRRQGNREFGKVLEDQATVALAALKLKRVTQKLVAEMTSVKDIIRKEQLRLVRIEMMVEQLCLGLSITPPARVK